MTAGRSFPRRWFGTFLVERGFAQKPQFPRIGQSFVLPMVAKDEGGSVRSPRAELPDERLAKEVRSARAYLFPPTSAHGR